MRRSGILPALDALALMAFVVIGLAQHDGDDLVALFLRNVVPLLASWFVVARVTGAYRRPGLRTLLSTWAVAVPAGLLLRTVWIGSPRGGEILVFAAVGLAFTLLLLVLARTVARALRVPRAPAASDVVR